MPSFSAKSEQKLQVLCPELKAVCYDAIKVIDFSVIETARDKETQDRYNSSGASQVRWPNSKHNVTEERPLAEAVDIWPYIKGIGAISGHPSQVKAIAKSKGVSESVAWAFVYKAFARLAGVMQAMGAKNGIDVRWGGDWDNDGDMLDQNFHDLPHFELRR